MKEWKLIFNTQSYDYVFIYDENRNAYMDFFYRNEQEIQKESSFFFIIPAEGFLYKLDSIDVSEYSASYSPLLKGFMEDQNKKTLFIEENLFFILVKEDKRMPFLKFLVRNGKNLVLFHNNKILYEQNKENSALPNTWNTTLDFISYNATLEDRLKDIDKTIEMTHNPFKDPFAAYKKLQEQNED